MSLDVAFLIVSQDKDIKGIAAEVNAWFDKGKIILKAEKRVKIKLCYLAVMNEIFNSA